MTSRDRPSVTDSKRNLEHLLIRARSRDRFKNWVAPRYPAKNERLFGTVEPEPPKEGDK